MATVQVRNLDDEAYRVLKTRAAASGRSLQEFLRLVLEERARTLTNEEVFARARARLETSDNTVTVESIVAAQREGRDR